MAEYKATEKDLRSAGFSSSGAKKLAKDINSLHPSVRKRYADTVKEFKRQNGAAGYDISINQAARTPAQQNAIRKTGVKAASARNTWHVGGGAADFTITKNGVVDDGTKGNNAYVKILKPIAAKYNLHNPIRNDVGHFQSVEFPNARAGKQVADFVTAPADTQVASVDLPSFSEARAARLLNQPAQQAFAGPEPSAPAQRPAPEPHKQFGPGGFPISSLPHVAATPRYMGNSYYADRAAAAAADDIEKRYADPMVQAAMSANGISIDDVRNAFGFTRPADVKMNVEPPRDQMVEAALKLNNIAPPPTPRPNPMGTPQQQAAAKQAMTAQLNAQRAAPVPRPNPTPTPNQQAAAKQAMTAQLNAQRPTFDTPTRTLTAPKSISTGANSPFADPRVQRVAPDRPTQVADEWHRNPKTGVIERGPAPAAGITPKRVPTTSERQRVPLDNAIGISKQPKSTYDVPTRTLTASKPSGSQLGGYNPAAAPSTGRAHTSTPVQNVSVRPTGSTNLSGSTNVKLNPVKRDYTPITQPNQAPVPRPNPTPPAPRPVAAAAPQPTYDVPTRTLTAPKPAPNLFAPKPLEITVPIKPPTIAQPAPAVPTAPAAPVAVPPTVAPPMNIMPPPAQMVAPSVVGTSYAPNINGMFGGGPSGLSNVTTRGVSPGGMAYARGTNARGQPTMSYVDSRGVQHNTTTIGGREFYSRGGMTGGGMSGGSGGGGGHGGSTSSSSRGSSGGRDGNGSGKSPSGVRGGRGKKPGKDR